VVGTEEDLGKARLYIGKDVDGKIEFNCILKKRKTNVTKREIMGKTLGALNLNNTFNIQVSRITRNGFEIPATGNTRINIGDIGLYLFLAVVGTTAGATIVATIREFGMPLLFSGIIVTIFPLIVSSFVCSKILKISFLRMLGVITGGMTSTPGLAATTSISNTPYASTAYATVYPVALIGMIIFTKLIVFII